MQGVAGSSTVAVLLHVVVTLAPVGVLAWAVRHREHRVGRLLAWVGAAVLVDAGLGLAAVAAGGPVAGVAARWAVAADWVVAALLLALPEAVDDRTAFVDRSPRTVGVVVGVVVAVVTVAVGLLLVDPWTGVVFPADGPAGRVGPGTTTLSAVLVVAPVLVGLQGGAATVWAARDRTTARRAGTLAGALVVAAGLAVPGRVGAGAAVLPAALPWVVVAVVLPVTLPLPGDGIAVRRADLVEAMDDPVLAVTGDGRLAAHNAAAAAVFPGVEGAVGDPIGDVAPGLEAVADGDVAPAGDGDRPPVTFEATVDGERRVYTVQSTDLGEEGRLLALREVTEIREYARRLERQTERLRRQTEQLDRFASVVSHDLRNPLQVARIHVDQLGRHTDLDGAEKAMAAIERMNELIDDALTLAREGRVIEADATTSVDLETAAEDAWSVADTGAATLAVESTTDLEADESRLRTLLENLFRNSVEHGSTGPRSDSPGNSVEHGSTDGRAESGDAGGDGGDDDAAAPTGGETGADGPLTVYVGALAGDGAGDGSGAEGFYVEDTGRGIPEDRRERVFEHGFSTQSSGTGLGLSIVKAVASAHGWDARVVDGRVGGARFEFRPDEGAGDGAGVAAGPAVGAGDGAPADRGDDGAPAGSGDGTGGDRVRADTEDRTGGDATADGAGRRGPER